MTDLVRHLSPEEQELEEHQKVLADLESDLADAEASLAELREELERFKRQFQRTCGGLFAQLDEVQAEIARRRASKANTNAAWEVFKEADRQARQSREAASELHPDTPDLEAPSDELRAAFRAAARKVHPDLATDNAERERRNDLMAKVNAAYARHDHQTIQQIIDAEEHRPEAVKGEGIGDQLVRVIRKIAQVRQRLVAVAQEKAQLQNGSLWDLFVRCRDEGYEVLGELAAKLQWELAQAKATLDSMKRPDGQEVG